LRTRVRAPEILRHKYSLCAEERLLRRGQGELRVEVADSRNAIGTA
jgi:hypothetical protein